MRYLIPVAVAALAFAGCSAGTNLNPTGPGASQPQTQGEAIQQSRPQPTATPAPTPAPTPTSSLTGRIVYTLSGLHIYNVATRADVSLGISGVNPKFSPDGTLITYQNGGIYVMNSDGTNNRLLNAAGGVPSFDPTGTMIVYSNGGIWRINVDGTGRTQLTNTGIMPTYSPDGTQISYNAAAGNGQQLFIMNADGTNAHQALTTSGSILDTVWRPGSKILFGMGGLYSYDPFTPAIPPTQLAAGGFEPSWSPDATHISWTNGTSGKSAGIWIMNADGTGQQGPVIVKGRQGSWGP